MPPADQRQAVLRLAANTRGRDFVIGDLHGCLEAVDDTLAAVGFDTSADRLFCCGDLVDRGDDNEAVVALIDEPWFYSVRGNHDQAAIDFLADPVPSDHHRLATSPENLWLRDLCRTQPEQARRVGERLASLPLAISIEGQAARIGIVHAGVPLGMAWAHVLRELEGSDATVVEEVLWTRPMGLPGAPVTLGVDRIYAGHTPLLKPRQRGNVWYIDGGGVYRLARARRDRGGRPMTGGWNVARIDTPQETLRTEPMSYGVLRVYGVAPT